MITTEKKTFWRRVWVSMATQPLRWTWGALIFIALLWTTQCAALQNILGLDILETISWGAQKQWGHFKHPPLSGWIGYWTATLTGHSDFAMYFLAQLCQLVGAFFTYKLARCFVDKRRASLTALLLYFLHYYNPSSMKYCSHFVEVALQPAMAYYFYLGLRDDKISDWLRCGVFSALAFLGKYSALALFPAMLALMLLKPEWRKRFRSAGPYLAGVMFLLLISPHVKWLADHDFSCFQHLEHRFKIHDEPWYYSLGIVFVAIYPVALQLGVLLLAWLPINFDLKRRKIRWNLQRESGDGKRETLVWGALLSGIPALVIVILSFTGQDVVAMWLSCMAMWTGMVTVGAFPFFLSRRIFRRLLVGLAIFTTALFIGTTIDLIVKPRLKIHTQPTEIINAANFCWRELGGEGEIPCAIGQRWFVHALENYAPTHPGTADEDDPFAIELLQPIYRRYGVLVICFEKREVENVFRIIAPEIPKKQIKMNKFHIGYHSLSGRNDEDVFYAAILPPEKPKANGGAKR